METKHSSRIEAEKNYKAALAVWNKLSRGNDEKAFIVAEVNRVNAINSLVMMEIAHPTPNEVAKKNRFVTAASRGLDVYA